jgi:rRNA maturation RNase YbeY
MGMAKIRQRPILAAMQIHISNRQKALAVKRPAMKALAGRLATRAFGVGANPFEELTVVLLDDAAMPACKERVFGVRRQTDVISLSYAAIPGIQPATAELVINAERALREGGQRPGGTARELALYLAHGLDHLAGRDDDTPARRRSMRRRETRWLAGEGPAGWGGICQ